MSSVEFHPRSVCGRCERPSRVCLCAHIREVRTSTRVVILQHPRESAVPIGTARLAALALPNAERHVGVEFAASAAVQRAIADSAAPAVLLYPDPAARDLPSEPPSGPITLVVIDGTWSQADKIFKRNPALAALPRYRLRPAEPSRYRIRREPAPDYISTIEAIVQALSVLEAPGLDVHSALRPFEALVEQQLRFQADSHARRHAPKPKSPRGRRTTAALAARAADLVAGYGEANAWPRASSLGPYPELVHWAAERVATGERFESYIAPRRELSPTFGSHNALSRERVLAGEPWEAFVARWNAFLRPSDVLTSWGFYASELLRNAGGLVTEHLDLRTLAMNHLGRKPGDVLECAAALGAVVAAPWAAGRTGVRLSGLSAAARALIAAAAPRR